MPKESCLAFCSLWEDHLHSNHFRKSTSSIIHLVAVFPLLMLASLLTPSVTPVTAKPHNILVDTDVDTDDFFAILYLLKQNRSEINLKAITINANSWADAGHAVNQLYDILYMMDRDDIAVGVGGEGGILQDGTMLPNVGGYLPLIEQDLSTVGGCRYRQAIPPGLGGQLDVDTNFGIRKAFLPQGNRGYSPLGQPTAQEVIIQTLSSGPATVIIIGAHTNFAIFLTTHPHLKKNVEHIYVMGGGVRSKNPTGCCPENSRPVCRIGQCGDHGNLFTGYTSNPYAEFNIFLDPFSAYQVLHSGIPITLVPLDATNTIPISKEFFMEFQKKQTTYEAQYCFKSLKMARDTWFDDQFYASYFMWDSFTSGIAVSIMRNGHVHNGENDFAEMGYRNITVVTSNTPYGIYDGSNPFFDDRTVPKFHLQKGGVHSGHVQMGLLDLFCLVKNGKGKCQDGYTKEVTGPHSARVLVAKRAKPNRDPASLLDREFFNDFLHVLSAPQQSGRFNLTTQFPYYKEVLYMPNFGNNIRGKAVVFDMDMSIGDFVALIYLLKVPVNVIEIKGILVSCNGWANAATIDVIYDLLHMMGRDDIPVGLGSFFALGQENALLSTVGDCKYRKAIPYGSGGFLDSDTLFGLSRMLPRSPRRYTAENSVKFGAPRDTDHPELRQPIALEVWESIAKTLDPGQKVTILTNGPLTNIAKILAAGQNATSIIETVYIVGGYTNEANTRSGGNVFTFPSNKDAEFNIFLDPLGAKAVIESILDVVLIPLNIQRKVSSFNHILKNLKVEKTPEAKFVHRLLSRLYHLQRKHKSYHHMGMFLGEVLGAAIMVADPVLKADMDVARLTVLANGDLSTDGQIRVDKQGSLIRIVSTLDEFAYYGHLANLLGRKNQSAVIGSFREQKRIWTTPNTGRNW
ncbi:nucleoside hydrolase 3 isoform X2 [Nymphaea colorata]|nr:nucleoside hydrolase 3 isoform X2 [Nymphaea colorata]XP_031480201.1 nucleoside hydrolase 3 isoform X2 [Nymphaea colorata]XP_049933138.1 nucleoside hydrolase 3 isoform X2 [Nymphaea colorata]XP_049933139.1 nucleoside hydrolase 3 isoform X2 [Nymphaea colorata]